MKVYVITKLKKTEKGRAFLKRTEVFISKVETIKWIQDDVKFEKEMFKHELEEYIKDDEINYFIYKYEDKILGKSKVEYQIWEKEL